MIKKETLILITILFLFFALQYKNFQKNTQSFRFGDESEHLTPAWMMVNYNSKLYKDITTNHQPLPILTSVIFFKVTKYQNPFMFIERLRQYMFLISFLGALILVIKFRLTGLIAVILTETIKFYLFGYHLLAESLALYPIMLIMGIITTHLLTNQVKISSIGQKIEAHLFGLCTFWVAFNLLPAWPFLIVANVIYFFYLKKGTRQLLALSVILPTLLLFTFINFKSWYHFTVLDNIKYFIPHDTGIKNTNSYVSLLIYPFQSIVNPTGQTGKYLFFLVILQTAAIILTIKHLNKKSSLIFKITLMYLLFILLNLRVTKINIGFYTAFHLLPLFGAFTITTVIIFKNSLQIFKKLSPWKLVYLFLGVSLLFAGLFLNTTWWRENINKADEHFVQYGDIESLGIALNILKQKDDKLLVGQLEGLLNIFADMPVAGRQNAYLDWSFQSEESRSYLTGMMNTNPPTFIYFSPGGPYFNLLTPYLNSNYTQIQRGDDSKTNAYILTSQIKSRTNQQWKDFENLYYKIPDQVAAYSN